MNIIKPSFEIWEQPSGIDGIYRQIERAGRVCYKSENHQTADSARPFVERMVNSQHTAMLEHATVYLKIAAGQSDFDYRHNRFTHVNTVGSTDYVTTNYRVIIENHREADMCFLTDPLPEHERRVTVHFTTQIAITREYNRHRVNSMAEQSTRYCNYSKAKFGNEISVNLPTWVAAEPGFDEAKAANAGFKALCAEVADGRSDDWDAVTAWTFGNLAAEHAYMQLIALGRKPQEARVVLPLDTNTELIHTAFTSDWKHFFDLRALGTTGAPHPDAKVLAMPLYEEFMQKGLI